MIEAMKQKMIQFCPNKLENETSWFGHLEFRLKKQNMIVKNTYMWQINFQNDNVAGQYFKFLESHADALHH